MSCFSIAKFHLDSEEYFKASPFLLRSFLQLNTVDKKQSQNLKPWLFDVRKKVQIDFDELEREVFSLLDKEIYKDYDRHEVFGLPKTSSPKVGRNDKCPCGSGKKYKKCCGI